MAKKIESETKSTEQTTSDRVADLARELFIRRVTGNASGAKTPEHYRDQSFAEAEAFYQESE